MIAMALCAFHVIRIILYFVLIFILITFVGHSQLSTNLHPHLKQALHEAKFKKGR